MQLFGHDPDVMASAAERVAAAGADLIDLNMGCPVPKVCKTGAGAALLETPTARWRWPARPARGSGLPVTVKLRSGSRPGDRSGVEVARRLAEEGVVAGLCIHPRHASQRHAGPPDYELARELVEELPVPVLISGGLRTPELAREAFERTGAAAVRWRGARWATRGCSSSCSATRESEPTRAEILAELDWVIDARRRAPRRRARDALPAQVLPLVRGAARRRQARSRTPCSAPTRSTPPANCSASPDGAPVARNRVGMIGTPPQDRAARWGHWAKH